MAIKCEKLIDNYKWQLKLKFKKLKVIINKLKKYKVSYNFKVIVQEVLIIEL